MPRTSLVALTLLVATCLVLPLSGCGCCESYDDAYYGNVFVANRTNTTVPEQAFTFRIAAFGEPFSGNLLAAPLDPAASQYMGQYWEDYYDAEAEMELGDLVEWFDRWVAYATDTYFDIF
jgi:hypothetical protein